MKAPRISESLAKIESESFNSTTISEQGWRTHKNHATKQIFCWFIFFGCFAKVWFREVSPMNVLRGKNQTWWRRILGGRFFGESINRQQKIYLTMHTYFVIVTVYQCLGAKPVNLPAMKHLYGFCQQLRISLHFWMKPTKEIIINSISTIVKTVQTLPETNQIPPASTYLLK